MTDIGELRGKIVIETDQSERAAKKLKTAVDTVAESQKKQAAAAENAYKKQIEYADKLAGALGKVGGIATGIGAAIGALSYRLATAGDSTSQANTALRRMGEAGTLLERSLSRVFDGPLGRSIESMATSIEKAADYINEMDQETAELLATVTLVAGSIATLGGGSLLAAGQVVSLGAALAKVIPAGAVAALGGLASTVGIIAAGFLAAAAAAAALYGEIKNGKTLFAKVNNFVVDTAAGVAGGEGLGDSISGAYRSSGLEGTSGADIAKGVLQIDRITGVIDSFKTTFADLGKVIAGTDGSAKKAGVAIDLVNEKFDTIDISNIDEIVAAVDAAVNAWANVEQPAQRLAEIEDRHALRLRDISAEYNNVEANIQMAIKAEENRQQKIDDITDTILGSVGSLGSGFSSVTSIIQGFKQGGLFGGIASLVTEISKRSPAVGKLNELLEKAFEKLAPIIDFIATALLPVFEAVDTALSMLATIFKAIAPLAEVFGYVLRGIIAALTFGLSEFNRAKKEDMEAEELAKYREARAQHDRMFEGTFAGGTFTAGNADDVVTFLNQQLEIMGLALADGVSASEQNMLSELSAILDSIYGSVDMATYDSLAAALEALTDSTNASADAMDKATEALTNVPSGYKVAIARFAAQDAEMQGARYTPGMGRDMSTKPGIGDVEQFQGSANIGTQWNIAELKVESSDPEEMADSIARRGQWQQYSRTGSVASGTMQQAYSAPSFQKRAFAR